MKVVIQKIQTVVGMRSMMLIKEVPVEKTALLDVSEGDATTTEPQGDDTE